MFSLTGFHLKAFQVSRSNHSKASSSLDKPCNSPRFIKQIGGDGQSLEEKFSGFIRILWLFSIHECKAGAWCKASKASRTLNFPKPVAMLLKTANWEADVKQQCKPAFSWWQPVVMLQQQGVQQQVVMYPGVPCAQLALQSCLVWGLSPASCGWKPAEGFPLFQFVLEVWGWKPGGWDWTTLDATAEPAVTGHVRWPSPRGWRCFGYGELM